MSPIPKELMAGIASWLNDNQGVVSVALFVVALFLGWTTGIFRALRRKPRFRLSLTPGPTFCCTYPTGKKHGDFEVHRTAIALYLTVTNVGSAASTIQDVMVAYHWHLRPVSLQWLRYTIGWFWLKHQAVALNDFHVYIGGGIKVFPFLTQRNSLSSGEKSTFLDVGQASNGVVYFEQDDSWGGCFPTVQKGHVRIKISVRDVFGKSHTAKFLVPSVSLSEARRFNPAFGQTFAEMRGEVTL